MKKCLLVLLALFYLAAPALAYDNVSPTDAYMLATADPNVYILDVRTLDEWKWVGHPGQNKLGEGADLNGKVINIAYQIDYKGAFIVNPSFVTDVQEAFPNPADVTLITMCRSGSRSVKAALALEAVGYRTANMLTGFEGGSDAAGYRTKNGWKVDGMPYTYSGAGYGD